MKNIIVTIILFAALLFFNQCSKDENNPVGGDGPVVDPITNQWTDAANADHRFNLNTYDSTVSRGIIYGDEDHPDIGSSDLCGFFDKNYVEFDVRRPAGRIKFKGNFENNNRITLQSSEGTTVITR